MNAYNSESALARVALPSALMLGMTATDSSSSPVSNQLAPAGSLTTSTRAVLAAMRSWGVCTALACSRLAYSRVTFRLTPSRRPGELHEGAPVLATMPYA